MSGFEVVGVVLGSVPLLISGLEHYRDGIDTIQNMVHYIEVVNIIVTSVDTNLAIYQQSCEALLSRLMLPPHTFQELLDNPDSPLWGDAEIASQLRQQFGANREYDIYLRAVKKLNQRISKLKSKLGLDDNFQPAWAKDGNLGGDGLAGFLSKSRKLSRAISIGFSSGKYLELVRDIERDVIAIKRLTDGAKVLEPVRAERKVETAAKAWLKIRDGANRMFKALESHWSRLPCPCQSQHVASVKLDMAGNQQLRLTACEQNERKFRLLLTFDEDGEREPRCATPWRWKMVEIQPILDNPDYSPMTPVNGQDQRHGAEPGIGHVRSPQVQFFVTTPDPPTRALPKSVPEALAIADLCGGLGQPAIPQPLRLLGFLEDDAWQHYLYIVGSSHSASTQRHDITSTQDYLGSAGQLGTITKFRIAAQLASAVLHFHGTPWLHDRWNLRDISLIRDPEKKAGEPYISKRFPSSAHHTKYNHNRAFTPNDVLFSLGVALLELSYGRPLLSFQGPEETELIQLDNESGNDQMLIWAKIQIADRLARELADREPSGYVDAVDRCLRCRFDTTARSLDEPKLLALFYQGVVSPLQDIYGSLCHTSDSFKAVY